MEALAYALYALAGFGLLLLLLFALLGFSLVFQAMKFAVTLAFAEHKVKRLRKASAEARAEINASQDDNQDNQATQGKPAAQP